MCKVSNKIKFCTCINDNIVIEELDNYWILYRRNKDKILRMVGMLLQPNDINPNFFVNIETIMNRLTEDDSFDIPIEFKNGDCLLISLNNNLEKKGEDMTYLFKYYRGQWKFIEYDPFELMWKFGSVKNGTFYNLWDIL